MKNYTAAFDGGATPNPGQMKIGGIIKCDDEVIFTFSRNIGIGTNNIAEYMALLELVYEIRRRKIESVQIQGDSALVINQVNGVWRAKNPTMKEYRDRVLSVLNEIKDWNLKHVLRNQNREADSLT
jgi:ribonuclease HI